MTKLTLKVPKSISLFQMIVNRQNIFVDHFLQKFIWVFIIFKIIYFLLFDAAITFVDSLFQPFLAVYVIFDELTIDFTVLIETLSGMCVESHELSRVTVRFTFDKAALLKTDDLIEVS